MNKKIVILGGGESGVGAAILAQKKGFDVFLSDNGFIPSIHKHTLNENKIPFEEGNHSSEMILDALEVIKSPGIPDDAQLILQIKEKNIPVISEIEFAIRYTKAKIIGITGTNGKTTTTLLTHHLLQEAGLNVGLTGNVGFSLAKQVALEDKEYYVVELSSFQLDGMFKSKLHVAVLLNITPDHLNRYNYDFQNYVTSKFRIIRNMRKDDFFIFNAGDPAIRTHLEKNQSNVAMLPVSLEKTENRGAWLTDKYLVFAEGDQLKKIAKTSLPLRGKHNMINSMAAIQSARSVGVSWEKIQKALKTFKNAPHRLEYCGSINEVSFYNDSKATNVDAVWYALESFDVPLVLILGGVDKGNDYTQIDELVKKRVKAIVALGIDNTKIIKHFGEYHRDISSVDSIYTAIEIAHHKAAAGEVVLLSPACASFDLFKNYEDRGNRFKEAIAALKNKLTGS
ncbi:MAG: UDP-N-acetylmuramoyl-L-alanine--D-glutamate ligase [Cyclobacteriaceae bacterium]|nr:UDP-N-acetylmuramoyl-L-alanine--D-glutamate ligase [Cyclobacteriaceae bacterium]